VATKNVYVGGLLRNTQAAPGNAFTSGPVIQQGDWDAVSNVHLINLVAFVGSTVNLDNLAGSLFVTASNKNMTSVANSKMGTLTVQFYKQYGSGTTVSTVATTKTATLTTFTAQSGPVNQVQINTDSDCAICWTFIGGL
jgi:hypothetical protein